PGNEDPGQPGRSRAGTRRVHALRSAHEVRGADATRCEGGDMMFGSGGRRAGAFVLALAMAGAMGAPQPASGFFGSNSTPESSPPPTVTLPDFRTLVERVSPAVVNISTKSTPHGPGFEGGPGGGGPGGPG